jgi:Zn-dependent protease
MSGTFRLGRILGIEVNLHWSWVFIFLLVTWTFVSTILEDAYPGWSEAQRWLAGAVVASIFFASILFHELSHSIVARRYGIPVSSITLFVFGGVSNLEKEPESARQEFWIAIVGPLASYAMALVFAIGYVAFNDVESGVADISARLAIINTAIGTFNLVPGFPLDGGRVLRSVFWARQRNMLDATRLASRVGEYVAYTMMGLGLLMLFFADVVSGIWLLLIGNFLRGVSAASYQQLVLERTLGGVPASAVARRDYTPVAPDQTVAELVENYFLAGRGRCVPVMAGEELLGILTLTDVRRVPRDEWPTTTAYRTMTPVSDLKTVAPADDLAAVLGLMASGGLNQIPVVEGKLLRGMIERSGIIEFIQARQLLGVERRPDEADPEPARLGR